ncbi:MAG: hypothetical protein ACYS8Y_05710 [Planctomycetota bacterium]
MSKLGAEITEKQGLVGAWYGESDLTNCKDADLIETLEQGWDESDGYGKSWKLGFRIGFFRPDEQRWKNV